MARGKVVRCEIELEYAKKTLDLSNKALASDSSFPLKQTKDAVVEAQMGVMRCELNLEIAQRELAAARNRFDAELKVSQTNSDIALYLSGVSSDRIINAIKAVREVTTLGLKEAKDIVDHRSDLPSDANRIKRYAHVEDISKDRRVLEEAGATVFVR